MDAAGQYALAYSLTTAAGVRAMLALALVSVATHVGLLHPPALFAWLASPVAMWILLVVSGAELIGDKVPLLDHALHVLQIIVKPAAAAIIVGGTVHAQSKEMLLFLMVVGALNALGVHAGVMTVRGASTVTTGGLANPIISAVEDAGAIGGVILAFVAPAVAAMLAICAVAFLISIVRRRMRRAAITTLAVFVALLVGGQAMAMPSLVLSEQRLFHPKTKQPLRVWRDATTDASRLPLTLNTADGVTLRGWLYPSFDPHAPYVITFHGNAETIADTNSEALDGRLNTQLDLNVVTFDYRGTGFSGGAISLAAARSDALAIFDSVSRLAEGRPVFICGWSLGSIFASHVAGNRTPIAGLILLDPISSAVPLLAHYSDVKKIHFIVSPQLQAGIRNDSELRAYRSPLLIVHGTADPIVPIDEGRSDFAAAASVDKRFVAVPGKGHSETIWSIEADNAINAFILKHSRKAKPGN